MSMRPFTDRVNTCHRVLQASPADLLTHIHVLLKSLSQVLWVHGAWKRLHVSFNCFETIKDIGRGTFGQVKRVAHKMFPSKFYALKCVPIGSSGDCLDEYCLKNLYSNGVFGCPFVVQVEAAWQEANFHYLLMEHCAGDAAAHFENPCNRQEYSIYRLMSDIASGLSVLHSAGFVHRDVKASNLLVKENGSFALGDLSMIVSLETARTKDDEGDCRYMAPELLENIPITPAADIFSLGLTVYELLTDEVLPQNGPRWRQLRSRHANPECEDYFDVGSVLKFDQAPFPVPGPLRRIVCEMLNRDPMRRPTASQVASWTADAITALKNSFGPSSFSSTSSCTLPAAVAAFSLASSSSSVFNQFSAASSFLSTSTFNDSPAWSIASATSDPVSLALHAPSPPISPTHFTSSSFSSYHAHSVSSPILAPLPGASPKRAAPTHPGPFSSTLSLSTHNKPVPCYRIASFSSLSSTITKPRGSPLTASSPTVSTSARQRCNHSHSTPAPATPSKVRIRLKFSQADPYCDRQASDTDSDAADSSRPPSPLTLATSSPGTRTRSAACKLTTRVAQDQNDHKASTDSSSFLFQSTSPFTPSNLFSSQEPPTIIGSLRGSNVRTMPTTNLKLAGQVPDPQTNIRKRDVCQKLEF